MTFDEFFGHRIKRENDCLIWQGSVNDKGYGTVRFEGPVHYAHRVAFRLSHGYWPGEHVLHSCDNPLCVNPAHLRSGTHQENMAECSARRRNTAPRIGNGRQKLSAEDLETIKTRFLEGETNKSAIAREYGVTPTRIRQVLR